MAKNKQTKKDDKKEVQVKAKGPKVDYTPKVPVIKKKEEPVPVTVVYHGEGSFIVVEEGASCSWNEASRQLCLDAAQEMVEGYTDASRPALYTFAARAALIENAKELTNAEYQYFGGPVTMGSHMKRQRFWKFVSYIGNGRIPNDLSLRMGARNPEHLSGEDRAKIMIDVGAAIKEYAFKLIEGGSSEIMLCRVSYVVPHSESPKPISFEVAPHDYNPETMKGYKTLKDWMARP